MSRPDTVCADCGTSVHWLEVFPSDRCVECHAAATVDEVCTASDVRAAFGPRAVRIK